VDLRFPESDVTTCLRELTLQDLGGGLVGRRVLRRPVAALPGSLSPASRLTWTAPRRWRTSSTSTLGQPFEVTVGADRRHQPVRLQGKW